MEEMEDKSGRIFTQEYERLDILVDFIVRYSQFSIIAFPIWFRITFHMVLNHPTRVEYYSQETTYVPLSMSTMSCH